MLMKLKKDIFCWVFSSVSLKLAIEWKQNYKKRKSESSSVYILKRKNVDNSFKSKVIFGINNRFGNLFLFIIN